MTSPRRPSPRGSTEPGAPSLEPASRTRSHEPPTTFPPDLRWDAAGLVAAVVQDDASAAVLMLGWMDREALAATLATGDVHFHSRSRGVLWRKGETSGNVLRLVSLAADCDGDALLLRARPAGPTCHTGESSCFHRVLRAADGRAGHERECGARVPRVQPARSAGPTAALQDAPGAALLPSLRQDHDDGAGGAACAGEALDLAPLFAVMKDRAERRPDGSYTVKLLDNEDKALKKLIEEAGEVALAVKNRDRANLVWEVADVLYHLAVIMTAQGIAPAEVNAELERRAGAPR